MPTTLDNPLIPNYSKVAKTKKNGYNSIFSGTANAADDFMNTVRDTPALQEYFKSEGFRGNAPASQEGFKSTDLRGGPGGSGPFDPTAPVEGPGGEMIYPWDSRHKMLAQLKGQIPGYQNGTAAQTAGQELFAGAGVGAGAGAEAGVGAEAGAGAETGTAGPARRYEGQPIPLDYNAFIAQYGLETGTQDSYDKYNDYIMAAQKTFAEQGTEIKYDPSIQGPSIAVEEEEVIPTERVGQAKGAIQSFLAPDEPAVEPEAGPSSEEGFGEFYQQTIMDVLKGGEGLPGTEEAISGMRESTAAYAKDIAAKAGYDVSKAGGIGQGTQAGAAGMARQNIMAQLAATERDAAAMRAGDWRDMLDKGREAFESDRAFDEGTRQFDETLTLQRDQFTAQFGEYSLRSLESMAGDNPVLLSKLIDTRMAKEDISFTDEEQAELVAYYEDKAKRQEAFDEAETTLLNSLPEIIKNQIDALLEPPTTETIMDRTGGDITKLNPGDWANLEADDKQVFYDSENFIKDTPFKSPSMGSLEGGDLTAEDDMYNANPWLSEAAGKYIEVNGELYKIGDPPVARRDNDADWYEDTQYKQYVNLISVETGKPAINVFETAWYD